METVRMKLENALEITFNFMNGRFGKRRLRKDIRKYWQWFTWGTVVILFFVYVFIPLMNWWQMVVDYINYVRWGI